MWKPNFINEHFSKEVVTMNAGRQVSISWRFNPEVNPLIFFVDNNASIIPRHYSWVTTYAKE